MLEIIINKSKEQKEIALVENGKLVEYYLDEESIRKEGNIYIGIVKDIVKGMQSAFVNIGTEKNSFIHLKDILDKVDESKEHKEIKTDISTVIKKGQKILVQVKKDSNQLKGARISTHINLPGKYIAIMPNTDIITVSQKIEDKKEQQRLKKLVKEMNRLHRKLAIHIKEKEKQTAKLSQVETMQKLSLIQNRIIDEMKKYATGCNESFVKSKFCVEMRIHFKKYPSLLTAKEQKKFSEVVNTKYHVFIQYLQAFIDMPEDDCLFCCLALAQFTTKECAFIRGVTNDAIRSQKTRIKKRLADSFASIELFEFIFSSKIKMNC